MSYTPFKYLFHVLLGRHDAELKYQLLLDLIILFIVVTVVVFCFVIIERLRKTARQKKEALILSRFEELLPGIMFAEEAEQSLMETIKTFNYDYIRRSPQNSEALVNELLKLYRQFTGDVAQRIQNFYVFSDLIYFSTRKLDSRRWHKVAAGINELSEMRVASAYGKIEKHIDSRNLHVREAAQVAVLRIKGMTAVDSLKQVKNTITPMQQVRIMQTAANFDALQAPDFSSWLSSENPSVIELGIKFIVYFQQGHCIESAGRLLGHEQASVVCAYLWAIGEMHTESALREAIRQYAYFEKESQLELLKAIEKSGNPDHLAFLTFQLTSGDFRIKMATLSAIQKCADNEMLHRLFLNCNDKEVQDCIIQLTTTSA